MLNPIEASKQIKDEFIGYITTSFQMADERYAEQFKKELQKEGLVAKGPYLDVSDSFVKGKSLSEMMEDEDHTVSRQFRNSNRIFYKHGE